MTSVSRVSEHFLELGRQYNVDNKLIISAITLSRGCLLSLSPKFNFRGQEKLSRTIRDSYHQTYPQ